MWLLVASMDSYGECKMKTQREAWVIHRFGRRLFERFFRSYAEKLSGISCKECRC